MLAQIYAAIFTLICPRGFVGETKGFVGQALAHRASKGTGHGHKSLLAQARLPIPLGGLEQTATEE